MTSTFHGLETAKRAMSTQQAGLYTTGNNVANANTPGYTRQRINMQASEAYPPASMNRPLIPGQIGTGVEAGSVQRIRESFLDNQFRKENSKLGYFGTNADALARLEDVLNETGKDSAGISKVLNDFWQSLQDLSTNPENSGARQVVLQRGQLVADTFNYVNSTIEDYRNDLKLQLDTDVDAINGILKNIDDINNKIAEVEPLGYVPNNLYDERDNLVDELSKFMDIQVEKVDSATGTGKPKAPMEGKYIITVKSSNTQLVGGNGAAEIKVDYNQGPPQVVSGLTIGDGQPITDMSQLPNGRIKSLIENYGYQDGADIKGTYIDIQNKLFGLSPNGAGQEPTSVLNRLVKEMNAAHGQGVTQNKDDNGEFKQGGDLFKVNGDGKLEFLIKDIKDLAASSAGSSGDSKNAVSMADTLEGVLKDYQKVIGGLAVDAQYANRQKSNVATLQKTVDDKRLSISSVSLDEEMMNMIKFQHAYNAAARNITVVDEMLDKIINGMGVVGR